MPDTRSSGHREKRAILHDGVINDDRPDDRYVNRMSNQAKVKYICGVIRYPEKVFDLDLPFPVDDWIGSEDNSLLSSGLYLSDLRTQYYEKVLKEAPDARKGETWLRHAEAEYWQNQFNHLIVRRQQGMLIPDGRTLN